MPFLQLVSSHSAGSHFSRPTAESSKMAETAKTSSLADQFEQLAERWLRVAEDAEDNERVEEYLAILKATAKKSHELCMSSPESQ
jgi:hypothetical protein